MLVKLTTSKLSINSNDDLLIISATFIKRLNFFKKEILNSILEFRKAKKKYNSTIISDKLKCDDKDLLCVELKGRRGQF